MNYKEINYLIRDIQNNKSVPAIISGNSMYPLIKKGSTVKITKISDYSKIKRFDIIIFLDPSSQSLICHYFWGSYLSDSTMILTRPLNPIQNVDTPTPLSNILGAVLNKKISIMQKIKIYLKSR